MVRQNLIGRLLKAPYGIKAGPMREPTAGNIANLSALQFNTVNLSELTSALFLHDDINDS